MRSTGYTRIVVGPDGFNGYGYFYVRLYWNGALSRRTQWRDPRFLQLRFFLRLFVLEWLRFPGEPGGCIAPLHWFEEDFLRCVPFGRRQALDYAARWPRSLPTSAVARTWMIFHAVFPSLVGMLMILVSWLVWTRRTVRRSSFSAMACARLGSAAKSFMARLFVGSGTAPLLGTPRHPLRPSGRGRRGA